MGRLVHRFRLGMALRFSLLNVSGDARPCVEPTGLAFTSQVVVWRRMIAGPERTRHPVVFGPLHRLPVGYFLARLKSSHRVHSIGFQRCLDFCAHPAALRSWARSFGCLTILSMLVHFASSLGTDRGKCPVSLAEAYAVRSTGVCTPANIGKLARPSINHLACTNRSMKPCPQRHVALPRVAVRV